MSSIGNCAAIGSMLPAQRCEKLPVQRCKKTHQVEHR
jgi:hypothetical protein